MKDNETKITFNVRCTYCKKTYPISAYKSDIDKYFLNLPGPEGLIQNIFTYLSADERELMMSQTCAACWDDLFSTHQTLKKNFIDFILG